MDVNYIPTKLITTDTLFVKNRKVATNSKKTRYKNTILIRTFNLRICKINSNKINVPIMIIS